MIFKKELFDLKKNCSSSRKDCSKKRKATNLISGEKEHSLVIKADRTKVSLVSFVAYVHFFEGERAKRFANFVTRNHETRGKSLDS